MRVLQIEDDSATAQSVELMLKSEGFNVYTTDLGEEGVDLAKIYDYQVITLDLGLPDISGLDVLRQIRAARIKTPIIVLAGSIGIDIKVKCFGAGADDFLAKPFHKDELVCRLRALILRSAGMVQAKITIGDLEVDLGAKRVKVSGQPVHLTGSEFKTLELLTLKKGRTCTKEHILNHLYGGMDEPEIKIIDVFVCKVRKRLREAGALIQTVWGEGYVLTEEPPARPARASPEGRKPSSESIRARILRALSGRSLSLEALLGELDIAGHSVRQNLYGAVSAGLVKSTGRLRFQTYTTSDAGVAHLAVLEGRRRAA